uniref:Zinc finger, SWIM-type containing 7 n=1 Tax=Cyprinus carpio TaxID=7962 RepID=A0A8C2EYS3_CYPCA
MLIALSTVGGAINQRYVLRPAHKAVKKKRPRWCGKHEHVFRCIMGSSLLSVAEQLLKDLQRTFLETNQIPDDLLIALRFVFGQCALQALDLVDQRSVTCVLSPSGRKAFQVLGGSGRLYTCFTSCHYCPCPAFSFSVLRRNESLMVREGEEVTDGLETLHQASSASSDSASPDGLK